MSISLVDREVGARRRSYVRAAPGFDLVVGLSVMTIVVGVAYVLVPIWAAPDVWERASGPFQTVFTAMLALTGPAIGMYMASLRRSST
ncbi:hypothetical protein [Rhodococcus sp. SJ-3]|uniref:hypothetical protein n=1 Tax=Rhodococcus sp. SJ-3 TaxID=3454628 RepID=UPI003F7AC8BD